MSKSGKITVSIIGLGLAFFLCIYMGRNDLGTSVINTGKKSYYQDENGELWESKKDYENYNDKDYYVAPDGTHWVNEYRYLESQR